MNTQIHPDVTQWALRNGSKRLKAGLESGHSMTPLVYIEWGEAHYPGFVIDLEDDGAWTKSECPSTEGLRLAKHYAAMPHVRQARVVIAKAWPQGYEGNAAVVAEGEAECLVVRDERIPYDLVMRIE